MALGVILALSSACVWGSGDFSGGQASRRHSQYQVLVLSGLSGLLVLVILTLVLREPWPVPWDLFWAGAAVAVSGALVTLAYRIIQPTADWIGITTLILAAVINGIASASIGLIFHYYLAQFFYSSKSSLLN